jgi:hypothetical protein
VEGKNQYQPGFSQAQDQLLLNGLTGGFGSIKAPSGIRYHSNKQPVAQNWWQQITMSFR